MAESLSLSSLSLQEYPEEDELKNLTLAASVEFILDANVMVIMRGVSGAGKSTIVKCLMEKLATDCVCSADYYFMKNGQYVYDRQLIKQAHEYCQQKATLFCEQGHSVVIIDNTNVIRWETDFYVDIANKHGYVVIMLTPQGQYCTSAEVLARRNKHGVPVDIIRRKLKDFSTITPSYFAWFFSKRTSIKLTQLPERMLNRLRKQGLSFPEYSQPRPIVHVTSLYVPNLNDEARKTAVAKLSKHIGRVDKIVITALVISKRTVSARVTLPTAAKAIYYNDKTGTEDSLSSRPGYHDLPEGHAAHITLGLAPGVKAKEAKSDMTLSNLCARKYGHQELRQEGQMRYYSEEELAVAFLVHPVSFTALFAGGFR